MTVEDAEVNSSESSYTSCESDIEEHDAYYDDKEEFMLGPSKCKERAW